MTSGYDNENVTYVGVQQKGGKVIKHYFSI